ncbi:MAG: EcsC family protein [Motilibacteraceae bacterium]
MSDQLDYEQRAWNQVQAYKQSQANSVAHSVVPAAARQKVAAWAQQVQDFLNNVPGAAKFAQTFHKALAGINGLVGRVGRASLSPRRVQRAYNKAGHPVTQLRQIRDLPLEAIDLVKPTRLDLAYTAGSFTGGAALGFLAGGGTVVAAVESVGTAGAGAGLGVGAVVSILATDAALTVATVQRGLAHVAAYYGYDQDEPEEKLFALGVLNAAMAGNGGKAAAYAQLNKLMQQLVRNTAWAQLNQNVVTQVTRKVFEQLGYRLTKQKLAETVPVVGAFIGGGMNAYLLDRAMEEIDMLYRERFLRERYGEDGPSGSGAAPFAPAPGGGGVAGAAEDDVDILDIIDAELVEDDEQASGDA